MKASILIVEDEPLIADDIAMILERAGYVICGIADNSLDAIDHLESHKIDLVLLDINIEGDRDGTWLAAQINRNFQVPFIFLTSYYDEKTLARAHSTNPGAYIVKPYDEGDLLANIHLVLLKTQVITIERAEKFFIRDKGELVSIETAEIMYAESDDNYTNIFTDKRKYVLSHTLKSVEEKLKDKGFIRNHKSFLVNFQKVTSIAEGHLFIGNTKIPIGRAYKDNLLKNLPIL